MSPTPHPSARRHKEVLFYSLLALIAAPLLEVYPNERVGVRGCPELLLPPTCMSRTFFGVSCPACGLTRSFVYLARGEWASSAQCHRLGWLLMLMAALQVPYRLAILLGAKRIVLHERLGRWIGYVLIALLIGNWALGVVFRIS